MCLVHDDQVKMTHTETAQTIVSFVDQTHHGWIGADIHPGIGIFVRHQIHRSSIWQMRFKSIGSLVHQSHAICQKQNALCPIGTL